MEGRNREGDSANICSDIEESTVAPQEIDDGGYSTGFVNPHCKNSFADRLFDAGALDNVTEIIRDTNISVVRKQPKYNPRKASFTWSAVWKAPQ